MSRGIASTHVLPPNPTFVDFERSDGSEAQWPTNTQKVVDHEGQVNFMRPIPMDESMAIKWRREVGSALAKNLKMADGPNYVLRSWPEGYKMFDHNKGAESNPRHDVYLIGSTAAKRFRSVPEFIPHAIWLMQDPTLDRANCACKYCAKKPQREISGSMGLTQKHSTGSATPSRAGAVRNVRNREQRDKARPYASVRRAPKPVKLPQGPKQSMIRERNNDLRAAYGQSKTQFRRWFREGELLWCVLDSPIRGIMGEEDAIAFWPGLVEEVKLKTEPILRSETASTMDVDATAATSQAPQGVGDQSGVIPDGNEGSEVPWTVRQYTLYKVKLLGISQTYYSADHGVLPYQAYAPSHELLQLLQDVPLEAINTSTESLAAFNPCPTSVPTTTSVGTSEPHNKARFVDAVAPYSLAIQIAASLAGFWTPTDDWEYKFSPSLSSGSSYTPPIIDGQVQTLHSVLTATMSQNDTFHNSVSETSSISAPVFAPSPLASIPTVTQTRYQGLWWGAERIWTDELVRLKVARRQIAPDGAENIYPPAGPSKSSIEYQTRMALADPDSSEFDAGGRGLFMRLDGLFVVEVPRDNGLGSKKECRASGMLFELADEDWEEPGGDKGRMSEEAANGSGSSSHVPNGNAMQGTNPLTSVSVPNSAAMVTDSAVTSTSPANGSSQSLPPPAQQDQSSSEQLSHPILSSPFLLPDPPKGFKFRPILPPGHEAVISLTLISGRYYPGILAHPLLSSTVEHALCVAPDGGGLHDSGHLWALEGLAPGFYNAVDPTRWKPSRLIMLREADKEARGGLYEHWNARAREKAEKLSTQQQGPELSPMENRAQSQIESQSMNVDIPYNQPHQAQSSTILATS
ncbi:hypothetical protein SERLA73DRAFT_75668 [Serpula lacrymans var. lacrymans S7.3]|uniref:Cryptic loci regulator 2 N-terminal domain-containing protein n=2 Tax=Serpula lacrymans var. lacrymans TaxID=341189 RepID=F8Q3V7_SERL3|nr:uncharacterized protein SERLADRAFT_440431 [Serpula lacrymans var. lacrymans S7.9]EGN96813.1 hypothetical protein SERLA73DRAFT_75668 [Serpula lacrymans var. lacrymans S7.3]EGO22412.1 hypothetical protein SERLADRAFT_440431 [Serpula lacrymans var. lacrymans S7.9]